jgi:2-polyprenyl-3-methyl-5-hydroxy-6-metoxy-1,4-benzoquinol methylase
MLSASTARFAREHGEWTAMAIKLPDGSHTRLPAADHRLRRLVQVAADVSRKPLNECRVLDLACLEGHYALEFGAHGSTALGIEGREVSVAKCRYARDQLGFDRVEFEQGDVRDFNVERHGMFDIIICSGILYHLRPQDAGNLIVEMRRACSGMLLLDTFISLSGREETTVSGVGVKGHYYHEHDADEDPTTKLWASLDNKSSFWFTEASLTNLLVGSGFTSVMNVLAPSMTPSLADRKTYLAIAGIPAEIFTSAATAKAAPNPLAEGKNNAMDASQHPRGAVFRAAKRVLPPGVKDVIKPVLRSIGILPPDPTPEFMRKKR